MGFLAAVEGYAPQTAQEARDRELILRWMGAYPGTVLTRENPWAHLTASSMILNRAGDRVLMVYHNLYRAWSWTGGHADGQDDPLGVALREAWEETGLAGLRPLSPAPASVEILPVWGHEKQGVYVASHLHLNVSFLLEGDASAPLKSNPAENSGVRWILADALQKEVSEREMLPVYQKLVRRAEPFLGR